MADSGKTERVLIYRLGSLGDMAIAIPALHLVARAFPNAHRVLLTNFPIHSKAPAAKAVLGGSGLVDDYISYSTGERGLIPMGKLWWKLRKFRPRVLVYLMESRGEHAVRRDARFFHACGISRIIGLPLGDEGGPRYFSQTGLWEHEAARLVRMLESLGNCDLDDRRNWTLNLTAEEKRTGHAALGHLAGKPFIVCGPGTKVQAKDWGAENWRQLLARLSALLPNHALALVGAAEDAQVSDYAAAEWPGPVVNLCGKLAVRESAAAMTGAELFIGPDSGPMHLAAIEGVPCAIAFAARNRPGVWYPMGKGHQVIWRAVDCAGCNLETCTVQKKKCLTSITVDEMLAAAVEAWQYGRKEREQHPV